MSYYAEIENGKVKQVLVVEGTALEAVSWLNANVSENKWIRTRIDGSTKNKYAGIGDEYHADIDSFINKPFNSWILDKSLKMYLPPIPRPLAITVGYIWVWVEATQEWIEKAIGVN